jgi:peptide/nickel transport system permease protein
VSAVPVPAAGRRPKAGGEVRAILRNAFRIRRTQVGAVLVAVIVLLAILGPYLAPRSTTAFAGIPFSTPRPGTPFGTDQLGRDVWSRFLSGGRAILVLSVLATALGVGGGAVVGIVAAYARNWLDDLLMRLSDVLLAFPQVIFVLLAVSTVGPKLWLIVVTVALTHLPRTARVIRGAAVEVVERDFVSSAEAAGESRRRIVLAEILPNVTTPLLVELGLRLSYSIAIVAAVGFLGFGLQPPAADWGLMINENRLGVTAQPWSVLLPILAIGVLTIGANLVADGLARAASGVDRVSS